MNFIIQLWYRSKNASCSSRSAPIYQQLKGEGQGLRVESPILALRKVTPVTVIPVKPWTPDKISGMFIVSRPIRSKMKPQKMTAKPQHALDTIWFETRSWLFLPTSRLFFHGNLQNPNCQIRKFTTVQVFLLSYKKHTDRKSLITAS